MSPPALVSGSVGYLGQAVLAPVVQGRYRTYVCKKYALPSPKRSEIVVRDQLRSRTRRNGLLAKLLRGRSI